MLPAPVGAAVRITYDATNGPPVQAGHYLQTVAGRRYKVLACRRVQRRIRGQAPRYALVAEVLAPADSLPGGATVHPIYWYPRTKGRHP